MAPLTAWGSPGTGFAAAAAGALLTLTSSARAMGPDSAPPARRPVGWSTTLLGVGDAGTLPGPAAGARLGMQLRPRPVVLSASFGFVGPARTPPPMTSPPVPGAAAHKPQEPGQYWLAFVEMEGCLSRSRFEFCAVLETGQLWGTGETIDPAAPRDRLWIAPGLRALATHPLPNSPFSVVVALAVLVPAVLPEYAQFEPVPGDETATYRAGAPVGRLELGLRVDLR